MNLWIARQWFMFNAGSNESTKLDTSLARVSNEGITVEFVPSGEIFDTEGLTILDESGHELYTEFAYKSYYGVTNTTQAVATIESLSEQFTSKSDFNFSHVSGGKPKIKFISDVFLRDEIGGAILDEFGEGIVMGGT